MEEQTYARYALPGLLLVLVIGLLAILVISGGSGDGKDADASSVRTATVVKPSRKTITVRAGDNPSAIAERAGIPLERLLELNPRVDPRALQVGDTLKLVP
jgi:LysM repeat protein